MSARVTHLYRVYGEKGRLLYVGITDRLDERLRQHAEKWWWREVRRVDSTPYATRAEAAKAETVAIKGERPKYNVQQSETSRSIVEGADPAAVVGPRRLVTPAVAAAYLDVSPRTIRRWVATGELTGYRMGSKLLRVDMAQVESLPRVVPTWTPERDGGETL